MVKTPFRSKRNVSDPLGPRAPLYFAEDKSYGSQRTVGIVGECLNEDGYTVRSISLVCYLVVGFYVGA